MSARERILDAAASLAARYGVTALGVERVVKKAGLSKGAFFYHFANKEEMVRGLLDHVAAERMAEVEVAVANGARFSDALVEMLVGEARENGALIHVLVASVALDPTLRATLTARSADWRRRMIEEDGMSEAEADVLRLAMDGLMIASVLYEPGRGSDDQNRAVKAIRSLIRPRQT